MATLLDQATQRSSVLARVVQPKSANLSAAAARSLLQLNFDASDKKRMHELAIKAQGGELSHDEELELDEYRRVGRLLDLLHSKARLSLKKRTKGA